MRLSAMALAKCSAIPCKAGARKIALARKYREWQNRKIGDDKRTGRRILSNHQLRYGAPFNAETLPAAPPAPGSARLGFLKSIRYWRSQPTNGQAGCWAGSFRANVYAFLSERQP